MLVFDPNKIFLTNQFNETALELFHFQYEQNAVYQTFVNGLHKKTSDIKAVTDIPFLPIEAFKNHKVKTTEFKPNQIFTSSGTTGVMTSKHFVKDIKIYEDTFVKGWQKFYPNIEDMCVLGLLPSYLEREGSSLVYMVDNFIQKSTHELSDFYLDEHAHLYLLLNELEKDKTPTLLIGVTFALLDFAAKFKMDLTHVTVMETGGMKGRRKELTRKEVHDNLKQQLGCNAIHSEYGMTELMSQAYSANNGLFECSDTMQVFVRSEDDPLYVSKTGKGFLNVIDLANVYSCAFIATDDIVDIRTNGQFEILGRADISDIRGCSLLTA